MCFTDDTVILIHDKNLEKIYTKANVIFNTTKSWFDNNLFELNLNKTKHIDIQYSYNLILKRVMCILKL